jgi:hypothetical protein
MTKETEAVLALPLRMLSPDPRFPDPPVRVPARDEPYRTRGTARAGAPGAVRAPPEPAFITTNDLPAQPA